MGTLIRQGHFLGTKLRSLRKRNGLTSMNSRPAACKSTRRGPVRVPISAWWRPGKRMPSADMLDMLAAFQQGRTLVSRREHRGRGRSGAARTGGSRGHALNRHFCSSHELLQNALPELLSQTGTTGGNSRNY